jgi:hypothetical protein
MFHLLFGPLLAVSRADPPLELAATAEQVSLASSLLDAGARSPAEASRAVTQLIRDGIGLRRKLETRLARAGVHSTDPRLICEAASELLEVVRQVARVVRCREWLRLDATPAEVRDPEAMGVRSVRLLAGTVKGLGGSGEWLAGPAAARPMKAEAEELYDKGVAAIFAEPLDPLGVLRRRALYDLLLGVVLGSDRALEALQTAYLP